MKKEEKDIEDYGTPEQIKNWRKTMLEIVNIFVKNEIKVTESINIFGNMLILVSEHQQNDLIDSGIILACETVKYQILHKKITDTTRYKKDFLKEFDDKLKYIG